MFVRMLCGLYVGEVREVKYETGAMLVREKRAARVEFDPAAPAPPPPAEIAVTPDVARAAAPAQEVKPAAADPSKKTARKKR
jgi:hypothetical protein